MPFTLAHPAAVIPLARTRLPASALVAGSLVPDFLYFIPGHIDHNFGHTSVGLVLFCIPVGLITLVLFHHVMKMPLLDLLPDNPRKLLARRPNQFTFGPWRRFMRVLVSLTVGSLTHLAWDSFTHERGFAVANVALLKVAIVQTPYGGVRVFKLLQHGSTLVGCAALIFWYLIWARRQPRPANQTNCRLVSRTRRVVNWALAIWALVTGLTGAYVASRRREGSQWARFFANRSILITIGALFFGLLLFSLYWHWKAFKDYRSANTIKPSASNL